MSEEELMERDSEKLQRYLEGFLEGFIKEQDEEAQPMTSEQRSAVEFWNSID